MNTNRTLENFAIPLVMNDEKPLASGNDIIVRINLVEPVLFPQGFQNQAAIPGNATMLRGSLHVRVQKSVKIKAITLNFKGWARTEWPRGIPLSKTDSDETDTIVNHTWPFFNAQHDSAEKNTGADRVSLFMGSDHTLTCATTFDWDPSPNHLAASFTLEKKRKTSRYQPTSQRLVIEAIRRAQ